MMFHKLPGLLPAEDFYQWFHLQLGACLLICFLPVGLCQDCMARIQETVVQQAWGWAYLGFQTSQLVPIKQSEVLQQLDCLCPPLPQACQAVPPQFITME
jgi:hypothetical protein